MKIGQFARVIDGSMHDGDEGEIIDTTENTVELEIDGMGLIFDADSVEVIDDNDGLDESMDGDHASALASAGFGTDEDYSHDSYDGGYFDE